MEGITIYLHIFTSHRLVNSDILAGSLCQAFRRLFVIAAMQVSVCCHLKRRIIGNALRAAYCCESSAIYLNAVCCSYSSSCAAFYSKIRIIYHYLYRSVVIIIATDNIWQIYFLTCFNI